MRGLRVGRAGPAGGMEPSTSKRALEQLHRKAEQLELSFADAFSDAQTNQVDREASGEIEQDAGRDLGRDTNRPRTKAKRVQSKKGGTGRHVETRTGSPPRPARTQDRARSSGRGRPADRSSLGSPARSLASPPRRAKSRPKSNRRGHSLTQEQKTLGHIEAVRQAGQAELEQLDQRYQRSLRLTRDDTDTIRNELVAIQSHTLREHQRRLAEMNAVRDQCTRAHNSTREVKDALKSFTEKAEQQQAACFDRVAKLEAAVRGASPERWQRDLADQAQTHDEKLQEINAQVAAVAASVSQLDAKVHSIASDHLASVGSLEELCNLAVQQSTTAVKQQQSTQAELLAEINLLREQLDSEHAALENTKLTLAQQREKVSKHVSADVYAETRLESLATQLRSEFADEFESHRTQMQAVSADEGRMQEVQTHLLQTVSGLRTENIDLVSSVEELSTLVSSITERCDRIESGVQQQQPQISSSATSSEESASSTSVTPSPVDIVAKIEQRVDEHSKACTVKIQALEDALADASMRSFGTGEETSLGLGDMLDEQHRHFTVLCAKLEGKIATLALSTQQQQNDHTHLASKLEELALQVSTFSHDNSHRLDERLVVLEEKAHGLSSAVASHYNQFHEMNAELLEACHETERGLSIMGQDCARAIEEQNQRLRVLDQKVELQSVEVHRIATFADGASTQDISKSEIGHRASNTATSDVGSLPSAAPNTICVTFTEKGPLGIKFSPDTLSGKVSIANINPGKQAERHAQLQPGLILTAVGPTSVVTMPYKQVIQTIKASGRPLTCQFSVPVSPASAAEVQEALLREAARLIEWRVGDIIDIDTEDGIEHSASILGPSACGDPNQMQVKFADGTTDDWDKEDFIVRSPEIASGSPHENNDGEGLDFKGDAAAVALQQEIVRHGTDNIQKITRLRRASMQAQTKKSSATQSADNESSSPTVADEMAAAVAAIDEATETEETNGADSSKADAANIVGADEMVAPVAAVDADVQVDNTAEIDFISDVAAGLARSGAGAPVSTHSPANDDARLQVNLKSELPDDGEDEFDLESMAAELQQAQDDFQASHDDGDTIEELAAQLSLLEQ